jgi:hypothetical protein
MQAELEELRISVEQAEKARKQADAELQAANDRVNELMMEINDMNKGGITLLWISFLSTFFFIKKIIFLIDNLKYMKNRFFDKIFICTEKIIAYTRHEFAES